MNRKKTNKKSAKTLPVSGGQRIIGNVHLQYVQVNVPESQVESTVEALAHALTSDYYAQYLMTKTVPDFE